MSTTFKMENGDFTIDDLNRFKVVSGINLLRQHVGHAIKEAVQLKDLSTTFIGDSVIDVIESLIGARLYVAITNLRDILRITTVKRSSDERISKIDAIFVKREKLDPRNFRFWVRVTSENKTTEDLVNNI